MVNSKRRFINNNTVYNIAATSIRYQVLISMLLSLSLHNILYICLQKTHMYKSYKFALYTISRMNKE